MLESSEPSIPGTEFYGEIRSGDCQTAFFAPHLPIAVYSHAFVQDWMRIVASKTSHNIGASGASESQYKNIFSANTVTDAKVPIVRVGCSELQVTDRTTSTQELNFPVMPEDSCWSESRAVEVNLSTNAASAHSKIDWIELPIELGGISTGLIYKFPQRKQNIRSMAVVTCSIDSRWVDGIVTSKRGMR